MFCLSRTPQMKRLSLTKLYGSHNEYVRIRGYRERVFSIQICLPPFLSCFSGSRGLWTTPCLLNQSSVDSTRKSSGFHPGLWTYNHQVTPSLPPRSTKSDIPIAAEPTVNPDDPHNSEQKPDDTPNKLTFWQRAKKEIIHYYHGFRLLGLEVKIASGICFRLLCGHSLTRRERKQLVRTVADIIRLVPFAVFIIVPFMEFLLPFYLKFFPFMLPSTFKERSSETDKIQQRLKAKLELTRFLQETLHHTTGASAKDDGSPTVVEFQSFLKKVQESGKPPTNEEITRFSKLFEDQVTLDSLQTKQLKMLCQLLSLPTIGPNNLLRFQIWMRVRQLKAEDKLLAKEGVTQIPSWELQSLCQDRGMRSVGLTEERLRAQLSQWLALHLEQNVPVTLLLFSRALHVSKATADEVSLKEAIAHLPSSASEEVTARVLETTPSSDVDPRTKIEVLRKEQASIKAAREQRKQELSEQQSAVQTETKSVKTETAAEVLNDTAPTLKGLPDEALECPPVLPQPFTQLPGEVPDAAVQSVTQPVSVESCLSCAAQPEPVKKPQEDITEISVEDLTQIESAIATSSNALNEEALDGLKEDVAETAKLREKHDASLVASEHVVDKRTSKAAARLSANVDRMINEMDHMIENLDKERQQLLKDIELREVHVKRSSEAAEQTEMLDAIKADHQRVVSINDLLLSLRRIQKVPDDARWQKILEVLDEDHDGNIELQHVLSVSELLEAENVKLSSKEVTRVLEMFDNEELVDSKKTEEDIASTSKHQACSSVPSKNGRNSSTSTPMESRSLVNNVGKPLSSHFPDPPKHSDDETTLKPNPPKS